MYADVHIDMHMDMCIEEALWMLAHIAWLTYTDAYKVRWSVALQLG